MLVSVSTGIYYQKSYKEILDVIKEAGAKHIELFLNDAFYDIEMETILNATFERGIKITSVHTPLPIIADKTGLPERIWPEKLLEFLEATGTYLTFDTTHYAPTGDIIDGFLKFKKYIKNIHLSDYDFKNQRDHQPILEGNLTIECLK